jgi:MFS family permease
MPNHTKASAAFQPDSTSASFLSLFGLNAVNFLLADAAGVLMPFLNDFLRDRHWRYDSIAVASALAGLGTFLAQAPAGYFVDHAKRLRFWLIVSSLVVGIAHGILPLVPATWWIVDPLIFVSGIVGALTAPLLAAIPLALVGYARLNRVVGANQAWNHAGNIAAAVTAMFLLTRFSINSVFYVVIVVSVLAAVAVLLIRPTEVDTRRAAGLDGDPHAPHQDVPMLQLLRERVILILFISTALFHLANAPVLPLVGLYIKSLGGTDSQVAATVLTAQLVMIPVAWLTGWLCNRWGRKPTFAIGFVVLPLRIFLYSLTHSPQVLVALQCLDGIGAGIYGVAIVAVCADVTHGKGRFNTLNGLIATALSLGGVLGPLASGVIVQHLGFSAAFYVFAALAAFAALVFVAFMPETKPGSAPKSAAAFGGKAIPEDV